MAAKAWDLGPGQLSSIAQTFCALSRCNTVGLSAEKLVLPECTGARVQEHAGMAHRMSGIACNISQEVSLQSL